VSSGEDDLGARGDQLEHLTRLGVASGLQLGIDQVAVNRYFEGTTGALDELYGRVRERLLDLGRQTGGPGFIVSDDAILNGDVHHRSPLLAPAS